MRQRTISISDIPAATRERFWSHVAVVDDDDSCWLWQGAKFRKSYGNFHVPKLGNIGAHIIAFILAHNTAPLQLQPSDCVLHRCDNPPCCRPKHLFKGTKKDNTHDMMRKGRDKFSENVKKAQQHPLRGSAKWNHKLTEDDVRKIKGARASGIGQKRLARQYGVRFQTIQAIDHGRTWGHVPLVQIEKAGE